MGPEAKLYKDLKKIPKESFGIVLKTLAYLVCLMCWATLVLATFSLLN